MSNTYKEERPWGSFKRFTHNTESTVKIIEVLPNQTLSLQSHLKRSEFWYVVEGSGTVTINEEEIPAKKGDEFEIKVGIKHRMSAGDNGLQILEIAQGDFDEADITRYEDIYGRA